MDRTSSPAKGEHSVCVSVDVFLCDVVVDVVVCGAVVESESSSSPRD
jgi:hypothetical protein